MNICRIVLMYKVHCTEYIITNYKEENTMYNYKEEVKKDVEAWVNENHVAGTCMELELDYETIYDGCFNDDSVTGNASGSYTFSTYKARCNVFEDVNSDEYLHDMILEGFLSEEELGEAIAYSYWEKIDVCIRCYLLGAVVQEFLDELDF